MAHLESTTPSESIGDRRLGLSDAGSRRVEVLFTLHEVVHINPCKRSNPPDFIGSR